MFASPYIRWTTRLRCTSLNIDRGWRNNIWPDRNRRQPGIFEQFAKAIARKYEFYENQKCKPRGTPSSPKFMRLLLMNENFLSCGFFSTRFRLRSRIIELKWNSMVEKGWHDTRFAGSVFDNETTLCGFDTLDHSSLFSFNLHTSLESGRGTYYVPGRRWRI